MVLLDDLRREHRELEAAARELISLAEAQATSFERKATEFFRRFYEHAVREEEEVFKPLRAQGLVGNAFVTELYGDHNWLYHEAGLQLRKALPQAYSNPKPLVAAARQLQSTMASHFRKEEHLLFQLAARARSAKPQ